MSICLHISTFDLIMTCVHNTMHACVHCRGPVGIEEGYMDIGLLPRLSAVESCMGWGAREPSLLEILGCNIHIVPVYRSTTAN